MEKTRVPKEVHEFLSAQGRKGNKIGGTISAALIDAGKRALEEKYGDWETGLSKEYDIETEETPKKGRRAA